MNGNLFFKSCVVFSFLSKSSLLSALIVGAGVFELPNGNRCIVLNDLHKAHDPRDEEQQVLSMDSLEERVVNPTRPLYVLTESTPGWVAQGNGCSVMRSVKLSTKARSLDNPVLGEVVTVEQVENRKMYHVASYILEAQELGLELGDFNGARLAWSDDSWVGEELKRDFWTLSDITFNSLYEDFIAHKEQAKATLESLLKLCNSDKEEASIIRYYKSTISDSETMFAEYVTFLESKGFEKTSEDTMYKMVYSWETTMKNRMRRLLINWYNPFFDFNAFAHIITLHKAQNGTDIMLIAGARHSWKVRVALSSYFGGIEEQYSHSLDNANKEEGIAIPNDILHQLFQEKTPVVNWDPYGLQQLYVLSASLTLGGMQVVKGIAEKLLII